MCVISIGHWVGLQSITDTAVREMLPNVLFQFPPEISGRYQCPQLAGIIGIPATKPPELFFSSG